MTRYVILIASALSLCGATGAAAWPDCAVRSGREGAPAVIVDGEVLSPLFCATQPRLGDAPILSEQVRLAAQTGFKLFIFDMDLDASDAADHAIAAFSKAHPQAYFLLRIQPRIETAWTAQHPEACLTKSDGTRTALGSLSSLAWREAVGARLARRIAGVLDGPGAEQFAGVLLTPRPEGPWAAAPAQSYLDESPAARQAFREWLRATYRSQDRLREAWGEPEARFDAARLPDPQAREAAAWGPFRDPVKHRPAIDAERFQSAQVVQAIAHFAAVVKQATRGRALAGAYYGAMLESAYAGPRSLADSGQLALGMLLDCRDLDLVAARFAAFERGAGQPGHLTLPVDSVALHGKLALFEEDTPTHLSAAEGADRWRCRDEEETLSVMRRNAGIALMHRCGVMFRDPAGDGRWADRTLWEEALFLRRIAAESRSEPCFEPQVAVLFDETAAHLLHARTYPVLYQAWARWRAEWDRTGAPTGYYLQADLGRLPDSVRVIVATNAYALSKNQRRAFARFTKRGGTVIWTYAPDLVGPRGIAPERIAAVTGIAVKARSAPAPLAIASALTDEVLTVTGEAWTPHFVVTGSDVDVVARYAGTDVASAAARPAGAGVSVYTATPRLPVGLLREIYRRAGVHLYHDAPGMTAAVPPYVFVHTDGGLADETVDEIIAAMRAPRRHTLRTPYACNRVMRMAPHRPWPMRQLDARTWEDQLRGGTTAVYRAK